MTGLPWTHEARTDASAYWRASLHPALIWLSRGLVRETVLLEGGLARHQERLESALVGTLDGSKAGEPVPSGRTEVSADGRALHPEEIDPDDRVDLLRWLGALAAQSMILTTDNNMDGTLILVRLLQRWAKEIWAYRKRPGWAEQPEEDELTDDDDRTTRVLGADIKVFLKAWNETVPGGVPGAQYEKGKSVRRMLINACLDIQHLVAAHAGLLDDETGLLARRVAETVAGNARTEDENEQLSIATVAWDQMMLGRVLSTPAKENGHAEDADKPQSTRKRAM